MGSIFGREPAMIVAFVEAVIALAVLFGLNLTKEQTAAILVVVALGLGLVVRQTVTPVAAPVLASGTVVTAQGSTATTTIA